MRFCLAAAGAICLLLLANVGRVFAADVPNVYYWDGALLAENCARIAAGDAALLPAYERLLADAEKALDVAPASVMEKEQLPPSGDKHDYLSLAIYFWPNPETEDGLPWVNRDGQRNPDVDKIPDKPNMGKMQRTVETLALAYYFSADERYAQHAAEHLRVWFLNPATRMNPHLTYAQGVPGASDGRPWGIIDTAQLGRVCDCAVLIEPSAAWTAADHATLQQWFADYRKWLLTSTNGITEGLASNNHGVYYDAQVAHFALFEGDADFARRQLEKASKNRIALQIEPDGHQPQELRRTKSWDYSVYNLQAFVYLARIGERISVDLWNYEAEDGGGIRAAIDFLAESAKHPADWKWRQIKDVHYGGLARILLIAAEAYNEPAYHDLALEIGDFSNDASRDWLLYQVE